MPEGLTRFQVQLEKIAQILITLPPSPDSALAFYKSPARQYLFYLEALTHIYKPMHNKKRFERLRIIFKTIEDQLGQIDYYDGFIKEFSVQENFPLTLLGYLKQRFTEEVQKLDKMMKEEGWVNSEKSILQTIESELAGTDWTTGIEERTRIAQILNEKIEEIKADYKSGKLNFSDIENGVHKFRREVRWLSIYAQALDGLIQLKPLDVPDPDLNAYLTKEVIESPYNVMPPAKEGIKPIYIGADHFYALSWLIAESGRLKDAGLRIILLEEAIRSTQYVSEKEVKALTRLLSVKSTKSLKEIKLIMKVMADKFMYNDKVLDRIEKDIVLAI